MSERYDRNNSLTRQIGLWLMAAMVALLAACGGGENDSILVAAAASLTDALVEAGEKFESQTGVEVAFSFGGSNTLARQAELGAPADAAIFAGSSPMDRLEGSGNIFPGSRIDLFRNRLVVISDSGTAGLVNLAELVDVGGRIALADPQLAPAGQYAKQALEASGLWDELEDRVIPTLDVRAAVGAVATGSARFGIVYATDAAATGVDVVLLIPESLHDPIVYPAAVIDGASGSEAAMRFLDFLASDEGRAVFERHGFEPIAD